MNVYESDLIIGTALSDHRPRHAFALFSGGHDSLVATHVAMRHREVEAVVHIKTGTGLRETFQYVQETCERQGWPLIVLRPPLDEQTGEEGATYRRMVLTHGFPGPSRVAHQIVYGELKDKALAPFIAANKRNDHDRILLVSGIRQQESEYRMGHAVNLTRKGARVWANPLFSWTADDCGEYMERHGLQRSIVKDLLHISGECLCGCYAKPGERKEIAQWFPYADVEIAALEARALLRGVPHRWGKRPGKYYTQRRKGQLDLFMCAGCMGDGAA